ncbi:MAG: hypothetical protein HRU46_13580 [Verrucomicrobiales bacterium]|nr:hypothetical protein [Verrucomicrobiales bacterium]
MPSLTGGYPVPTWSLDAASLSLGMMIDPVTGEISWDNPVVSATPYTVTVSATNAQGTVDLSFLLTVNPFVPVAPVINQSSVPAQETVYHTQAYTGFLPVLSEPGSPPGTWSLVSGPAGMTIDPATGVVAWDPASMTGSPHTIVTLVSNAAGTDSATWTLVVEELLEAVDSATGGDWNAAATWSDKQVPSAGKTYNALHDLDTTQSTHDGDTMEFDDVFGGDRLFLNDHTLTATGFNRQSPLDRWDITANIDINGGVIVSPLRQAPRWHGEWTLSGDLTLDAGNSTEGTQVLVDLIGGSGRTISLNASHATNWNGRFDFGGEFLSEANFSGTIYAGGGATRDHEAHGSAKFLGDVPVAFFHLRIFDSTDGAIYSDGDNDDNHGKFHLANDVKVLSISVGNETSGFTSLPAGTYDYAALANVGGVNYQKYFVDEGGSFTVAPPVVNPDGDSDSLPDQWELDHFGALGVSNGGDDDFDKDGSSDVDEQIAGTDPTDSGDHFHIGSHAVTGNSLAIVWDTVAGRSYEVYYSTNLVDWTYHSMHSGDGGQAMETIDTTGLGDSVFVRVMVVNP